MEDLFTTHLSTLINIILNIILVVAAYYRLINRTEKIEMRLDVEEKRRKESLTEVENTRLNNVKVLREIYDQKILDTKNYSKALFEQKSDSLDSLQKKVDKIETRLESMATQKSVDELSQTLSKIIGLIMDNKNKNNEMY